MFSAAERFDGAVGTWDTSSVDSLSNMFAGANFNQDISRWDTARVTTLSSTFNCASSFNQAIGRWNTANVKNMRNTFRDAEALNQALCWQHPPLQAADSTGREGPNILMSGVFEGSKGSFLDPYPACPAPSTGPSIDPLRIIYIACSAAGGALLLISLLVRVRRATRASAGPPSVELAQARVGDAQA